MKLSLNWIKDFTPYQGSLSEFVDKMTLSGSKVEEFYRESADLSQLVTGKIEKIDRHPDADKLVVCQLDIGHGSKLQVVTGADNVREGQVVPVALDGATLAGGLQIKASELRGVESDGMMCSIQELGFSRQDFPEAPANGIYIFPEGTEPGQDVVALLGIDQEIIDFEITSNRVDCYSVEGLARETAITFQLDFTPIDQAPSKAKEAFSKSSVEVRVEDTDLCPRYMARAIKNVKIGPSPRWMRERLRSAGVRPINNIVDITNFVMLSLGQPMHAFDLDFIKSKQIIVRRARDGEEIVTLDGNTHQLTHDNLVIADGEGPVALAGVMGAENSEVKEDSHTILFEVANFEPMQVRATAKQLGLRTESSTRFDKGLSPVLAERAMNYACYLVELLECGEVASDWIDQATELPENNRIEYSDYEINALLGLDLSEEIINQILTELGLKLTELSDGYWQAEVPYYRPDLQLMADLAEEVARIYGYDQIPDTLQLGKNPTVGKRSDKQLLVAKIHDVLTASGAYEAYTSSFTSEQDFNLMNLPKNDHRRQAIRILNPLGVEDSLMRTSVVPAFLKMVALNYARGNQEACFYELGKTYHPVGEMPDFGPADYDASRLPDEREHLSFVLFSGEKKSADLFFQAKAILDQLAIQLGLGKIRYTANDELDWLHPGQTAEIHLESFHHEVGYIGTIHPRVARKFSCPPACVLVDLWLKPVLDSSQSSPEMKALPKFPSITRDLALVAPREMPVSEIEDIIEDFGSKLLVELKLFDVYQGKNLGQDKKSVAFNLVFRAEDKTLSDQEVNPLVEAILDELTREGIQLRK